ncbi:MAG: PCMD domain-containing protein [Muribaculaceae bacterium]|nr:PCMD domain-containing protein [Muribaculaceae bacterium]
MKDIIRFTIITILVATGLAGCIHNDLPYPKITQTITEIEAVGQSRAAFIDVLGLKVTLYLEETTDIENVRFSKFEVSEGGVPDIDLTEGTYNLTKPLFVEITRYQTYLWEITAEQNIERYFTVEGQIGETVIDPAACRVIVYLPESIDLSDIKIESIKLGPEDITTYQPVIQAGSTIDLNHPYRVEVTAHGRTEYWTIYAEVVEQTVGTDNAEAWSEVVWVYGSCEAGKSGSFQYKASDSEEWKDIDPSWLTQNGGTLSCYIPHLEPLTSYDVRTVSEGEYGNIITLTTQGTMDLPDGSFDQWWLKDGKVWCPWNEGGTPYWDTGNTGAATLGQSNVVPTDHTVTGSGKAAELNTKFVGILGIGKLGAGSIYTGSFSKVDGTNGILDFGRQFNLRPTKLRGYYQYKTAKIDYASKSNPDLQYLIGEPDTCHIYIALTDWTAPYQIRTNPNTRQLFDKDADYIIAYGELLYSGTMEDYAPFEIELQYRDYFTKPSYIQITCAASKYGDFFTGGNGATLYVDEFSLDYDY